MGGIDATNSVVVMTGRFEGVVNFGGGDMNSMGGGDIYLAGLDASGSHLWSRFFGDSAFQQGTGVVIGDRVYCTGEIRGNVNIGGAIHQAGGHGNVVAMGRGVSDGAPNWGKDFGDEDSPPDAHDQIGQDIALDSGNNILLTGEFGGVINFGGGGGSNDITASSDPSGFITKLTRNGNHVWSKGFGAMGAARGRAVAVDSGDNVVLTGDFNGTMNLDGMQDLTSTDVDVFVAKLDPDGNHLWSRRFGGADDQVGTGIGTSVGGDVLVAGDFKGTMQFGPTPLTANDGGASTTAFIAKLAR